jgi:hypothetical protein
MRQREEIEHIKLGGENVLRNCSEPVTVWEMKKGAYIQVRPIEERNEDGKHFICRGRMEEPP